jgi:hypothetical protein
MFPDPAQDRDDDAVAPEELRVGPDSRRHNRTGGGRRRFCDIPVPSALRNQIGSVALFVLSA